MDWGKELSHLPVPCLENEKSHCLIWLSWVTVKIIIVTYQNNKVLSLSYMRPGEKSIVQILYKIYSMYVILIINKKFTSHTLFWCCTVTHHHHHHHVLWLRGTGNNACPFCAVAGISNLSLVLYSTTRKARSHVFFCLPIFSFSILLLSSSSKLCKIWAPVTNMTSIDFFIFSLQPHNFCLRSKAPDQV